MDWVGQLVPKGYDRNQCEFWIPMHSWAFERLIGWAGNSDDSRKRVDGLINDAVESFAGQVPDSDSLQLILERNGPRCPCKNSPVESMLRQPSWVLERVRELVGRWFPEDPFASVTTPIARYKNESMSEAVTLELPVEIGAAIACCGLASEEANRADAWHRLAYSMKGKPTRAGCRYAQGVYLYRRHTTAAIEQIATIFKIPTWE